MTATHRIEEVSHLLSTAVGEVFATMLTLGVQRDASPHAYAAGEPLLAACVGFTGEVNGVVALYMTASCAHAFAARMLGMEREEFDSEEIINDAIGELGNMIVGGVKSRLCDEGMPCVLSIPAIVRGRNFSISAACKSDQRLLGFVCGGENITLELMMKPAR